MRRNVLRMVAVCSALATVALFGMRAGQAVAAEGDDVGAAYKLAEQPKDAAEVIATRESAENGADVVVVGRIGGRANPWLKGAAAFTIADRSLTPCNEIEGDTCKTPWDYCCEADLGQATALVMFVDDAGKVVKQDARELLGVKELDTVYLVGKAKRDKSGNVTVMAAKVYVETPESGPQEKEDKK
jgi:hypothetical protein